MRDMRSLILTAVLRPRGGDWVALRVEPMPDHHPADCLIAVLADEHIESGLHHNYA